MLRFLAVTVLWLALQGYALAGDVVSHEVQEGESVETLARFYGLTAENLARANPDVDLKALEPGLVLQIPRASSWPRHQVEPGQTLWSISKLYQVRLENLRQANDREGDRLLVGEELLIPRQGFPTLPTGGWVEVTLTDGRKAWAPVESMLAPAGRPLTPPELVSLARRLIGTPYRWGGVSPNGVDCSGFVQEVFRLGGYGLRRTADLQFADCCEIPREQMQMGDLLFFSTYEPGPSHVGICTGPGLFLHASSSRGVVESSLEESYFAERFLGVRRIHEWHSPPPPEDSQAQLSN
ncbi:peptidoglycan endopeptidase [bacterium CPR1]|nr:peptidoglycan endopeptidase [bacterium CPR1]